CSIVPPHTPIIVPFAWMCLPCTATPLPGFGSVPAAGCAALDALSPAAQKAAIDAALCAAATPSGYPTDGSEDCRTGCGCKSNNTPPRPGPSMYDAPVSVLVMGCTVRIIGTINVKITPMFQDGKCDEWELRAPKPITFP